jgi:DNA replication protein DnaC
MARGDAWLLREKVLDDVVLAALCKPKLLIIDEMGYLPFDRPLPTSSSS